MTTVGVANDRRAQVDDIREAAFRYLFDHNGSVIKNGAEVYFLALASEGSQSEDPTGDFLERFAGQKPRVAPVSNSKTSLDEGARDTKTGEKGLIFHVGRISWTSDDEVVAEGGYYEGGESASSGIYFLTRTKAGWAVHKEQTLSISSNNSPNQWPLRTAELTLLDLGHGGPGSRSDCRGREIERKMTADLLLDYLELVESIPAIVRGTGLELPARQLQAHFRAAVRRAARWSEVRGAGDSA